MTVMCKVDGCDREAQGRTGRLLGKRNAQLCGMHYQRLWAHGDVGDAKPLQGKRGAGNVRENGYVWIHVGGNANYEHIIVAERALGRALPAQAEVHHANEMRSDNRPENLVICPDDKYHALLHLRMKARDAGYPAHYRKCGKCKQFDDPENMRVTEGGKRADHKSCTNKRAIFFGGELKTAADWARHFGVSPSAICMRLQSMSVEEAFTRPFRRSQL